MSKSQNPAALVRRHLLEIANQRQEPFQMVLERYALERLLFRLGETADGAQFLLKGGMLLTISGNNFSRSTRDMDLLGYGQPNPERLSQIFIHAASQNHTEDGMKYDTKCQIDRIKEGQEYEGLRIKLKAWLSNAEVTLKIDIGFGDAVLEPCEVAPFQTILSLPSPAIKAYPLESVMAEKLHAMISLGVSTSRMKDIYDLYYLASLRSWSSLNITKAVQLTFTRRQLLFPIEPPIMFTSDFYENPDKLQQWRAFQKKSASDLLDLKYVLVQLELFWWPLLKAIKKKQRFDLRWEPAAWKWN